MAFNRLRQNLQHITMLQEEQTNVNQNLKT